MKRIFRIVILISLYPLFLIQNSFAALDRWSPTGPFNFVGFISDEIAFDKSVPGTLYLSAGVGIYRTTNGGSQWKPVDLKGLFLNQDLIRIDPNDNKHVIVGGFPLFESFDSGANWQKLSDLPPYVNESNGGDIGDFQFHPSNSSILYLVNVVGVHKSTDGGKTWVRKNRGLPDFTPPPGLQIQIDPNQPDTLYVLFNGEFPHQIFKSTDGAETWRPADNGIGSANIRNFLISKLDPQILIAVGRDGIFRTGDGGASWKKVHSLSTFGISADPNNFQKLYATPYFFKTENHFVLQSNDGGTTWNRLVIPSQPIKVFVDSHDSSRLYIIDDQGILFSQNAGKSWKRRNVGILEQEIRQLESHPAKKGLIYAAGNFLFRSNNSGKSWQTILPDWFVYQIRIHPKNPNLIFVAASQKDSVDTESHLLLSRDGGIRWEVVTRLPGGSPQVLQLDPNNPGNLYMGFYGLRGVYKSTDEGRSWSLLGQGIPKISTTQISVSNQGSLIFAVSSSRLFRTNNSGNNWKVVSSIRERIFSVAIHPKDSKFAFSGGAGGTIFKSIDGGVTWQAKHRFRGSSIRFLQIDRSNPNLIYAGGDNAIFVSIDKGENWSVCDTEGLNWSSFQLSDLLIKPWGDPFFVAATRGSVWTYQRSAEVGNPVIRGLSVAGIAVGENLIVYGANFGTTPGTVDFNGITAQNTEWSDQVITVSVPSAATTGQVKVIANGKESNTQQLVVISNSAVMNPTIGNSSGGEMVAIVLPSSCLEGVVLFGSTVAHDFKCIPPNLALSTAPAGTGSVEVTYQSSSEPSRIFNAGIFSYSP